MKTQKFDTIIESYLNGNISWVKAQVKKLSKEQRKALYQYGRGEYFALVQSDYDFFLNLI